MNCNETQDLLSGFYDDELSVDVRAAVAEHLQSCQSCARALTEYEQLSGAFSGAAAPPVPPGVWGQIVRGLDADNATESVGRVKPLPAVAPAVELASSTNAESGDVSTSRDCRFDPPGVWLKRLDISSRYDVRHGSRT